MSPYIREVSTLDRYYSFIRNEYDEKDKIALVDIDDTLGPMTELIIDWAKEYYNCHHLDIVIDEYGLHQLIEAIGVSSEKFFYDVKCSDILERFEFHDACISFLTKLESGDITGFPLHVALVTSRYGFYYKSIAQTIESLINQNIPHCSLTLISIRACKMSWAISAFGSKLAVVVEDKPQTLQQSLDRGLITFKVPQPYNADVECDNIVNLDKAIVIYNGNEIQLD